MSEENSNSGAQNEPPEWWKNPPEWFKQIPQSSSQPSANNPPHGESKGYGQDILLALQALPEKLADSVKEMFPNQPTKTDQQQESKNSPTANDKQDSSNKTEQKETTKSPAVVPGKKTFAERWFG